MKKERIAKLIARSGVCSRREAERLITEGKVLVDGTKLDTPAFLADENNEIIVNGKPLPKKDIARLWIFNKPKGCITSNLDPEGRKTIFDILPKNLPRVITIGRLDYNSEGLLLLTNDGELARKLELPSTGWIRRYKARAFGNIDIEKIKELGIGATIEGIKYAPADIKITSSKGSNHWLEVAIREGKNREVRKMLAFAGLEVNRLIRISFGDFRLGKLAEGEVIEITGKAVKSLI